jgi:hypothetical protein
VQFNGHIVMQHARSEGQIFLCKQIKAAHSEIGVGQVGIRRGPCRSSIGVRFGNSIRPQQRLPTKEVGQPLPAQDL